jgi:hypothetical protein
VTQPAPDRRLATAMANRLSGCKYRDLLRLARYLKIKRPTKMRRGWLEMEIRFMVYPNEFQWIEEE